MKLLSKKERKLLLLALDYYLYYATTCDPKDKKGYKEDLEDKEILKKVKEKVIKWL